MAEPVINKLAPEELPPFFVSPDGSDPFLIATAVFVLLIVIGVGVLFFTLHNLPEKFGEGLHSSQLQLIGILCLLALFTDNYVFWVAAIALAVFRMPDFIAPVKSIASSLKALAKDSGKEP